MRGDQRGIVVIEDKHWLWDV